MKRYQVHEYLSRQYSCMDIPDCMTTEEVKRGNTRWWTLRYSVKVFTSWVVINKAWGSEGTAAILVIHGNDCNHWWNCHEGRRITAPASLKDKTLKQLYLNHMEKRRQGYWCRSPYTGSTWKSTYKRQSETAPHALTSSQHSLLKKNVTQNTKKTVGICRYLDIYHHKSPWWQRKPYMYAHPKWCSCFSTSHGYTFLPSLKIC